MDSQTGQRQVETPGTPSKPRARFWRRAAWLGLVAVLWAGSLVGAVRVGELLVTKRESIKRRLGVQEKSGVIETGLYFVQFAEVEVPRHGRYGGVARLGGGILHASRNGTLTLVGADRKARALPVRIPVDVDQFEADLANKGLVDPDHFAVKDLLVQPLGGAARLVASFNYWDGARSCYGLRVASLEIRNIEQLDARASFGEWTNHYDTAPCASLGSMGPNQQRATLAAGGRLVALSDSEVLLSVGGGFAPDTNTLVDPSTPFGKTIRISLATGVAQPFTSGHRNAQGLFRAIDGTIYLTEHGDRGGDELNVLQDGLDFGWPRVTYGTSYGSIDRPANPRVGQHEGFAKPMFSWVPSIGVSEVIGVEGNRFGNWKGDLLVSSLRDQGIFRLRIDDGVVRYAEPIRIGYRLRDVVESATGEIVLLADNGPLIFLAPLAETSLDGTGSPLEQGRVLAAQCSACHSLQRDGPNAIGPALWGVVGRPVASDPTYAYSQALRELGGRWTPSRLRAYLRDPAGVAAGTSMQLAAPLTREQVNAIVEHLRTLR